MKILTLDIDSSSLRQLQPAVMDMGAELVAARNVRDALEQIAERHPDVLLLDLDTQQALGYTIIDRMGESERGLPVVFLTHHESAPPNLDGHPTATLNRPIVPQALREVIGRVVNAERTIQVTPTVAAGATTGQVSDLGEYGTMLCNSRSMQDVLAMVDQVAPTDITVLVRGESGTGKELIARTLQLRSLRPDKAFVKVLCAALPEGLLESELFGYERGAFTGAHKRKPGKFEFAHHGTIFLDEIGEIPLTLQAKLLQVLQDGEFVRLGGEQDVRVDVRIIAATNRDLEMCVRAGTFREDLFYRLNVVTITLPPLRDRMEELPFLCDFFVERFSREYEREMPHMSTVTMDCFNNYHWPGNIRELENMIKQIVVLGNESAMLAKFEKLMRGGSGTPSGMPVPAAPVAMAPPVEIAPPLPEAPHAPNPSFGHPLNAPVTGAPQRAVDPELAATIAAGISAGNLPLKELGKRAAGIAEREAILQVLGHTRWNRRKAATLLGISYKALLYKIRDYGLNDD